MKLNNDHAIGPQCRASKEKNKLTPLLVALSIAAGLQTSTQVFAHQFNYQPVLGANTELIYARAT